MRRLTALLAALLLVSFPIAAFSATSAEPATVGWWWQVQQLPEILPVTLPAPPFVAKSELLVESLLGDADAIAAVQIFLPADRVAKTLTLHVTPAQGTPTISACANTSGWAPAVAGSWDLRPTCGSASIPFVSNKAGTVLTLDVSKLATEGQLNVVLSPTLGGDSTFTALIQTPDTDALTTAPAPPTVTTLGTVAIPPTQAAPPDQSVIPPVVAAPDPTVAPAPAPTATGASTAPQVAQPTLTASTPVAKAKPEHRTLLIVLLIAVIVVAGGLSRVPTRTPRALVRTAGSGE